MTINTDLATAEGTIRRLVLRIDGLNYDFWQPHDIALPSSGWTRTALECFLPPDQEFTMGLDFKSMKSDPSRMSFELGDLPDPNDATKLLFAQIFAPGRWNSSSAKDTIAVRKAATEKQIDADATSLYGKYASGWDASGEAHIGRETFSYTGIGTTTETISGNSNTIYQFTGVTKGLYPCVGASNYGYTYPLADLDNVSADMADFNVISTVPYTMLGRRVALYVTTYDQSTGEWHTEAESLAYGPLWVGTINDAIVWDPAKFVYKLSCQHILAQAWDQEIARDLPTGEIRMINLSGDIGRNFGVREDSVTGAHGAIRSVTVAAPAVADGHPIAGYTADWLSAAQFFLSAFNTAGYVGQTASVKWSTSEFPPRLIVNAASTIAKVVIFPWDVVTTSVESRSHLMNVLGFPFDVPIEIPLDSGAGSVPTGTVYSAYHPLGTRSNGSNILIEHSAIPADQGDYSVNRTTIKAKVEGKTNAPYVVAISALATATNTLSTIAPKQRRHYQEPQFIGTVANDIFDISYSSGDRAISVSSIYKPEVKGQDYSPTPRGPFELLYFSLISSGTSTYQDGTYDVLNWRYGAAVQDDLVDQQSFLDADKIVLSSSSDLSDRGDLEFDKPTTWGKWAEAECKLFGVALVWSGGKITAKHVVSGQQSLWTQALSVSNKAAAVEHPSVTTSTGNAINSWKVRRPSIFDGKMEPLVTVNDRISQQQMQLTSAAKIDHPGLSRIISQDKMAVLLTQNFKAWMPLFRLPWQELEVTLAPTLVNLISVGDFVQYTNLLTHPNPYGDGSLSTTAFGLVKKVSHPYSGDKAFTGKATLLINSRYDPTRKVPWAASALIDKTATTGGWDSANYRLTLIALKYGAAGDSDDGAAFADGDLVKIIETAPADPTSPTEWGPIAVASAYETDGAQVLTLATITLTGYDTTGATEYAVITADYSDCTAAQILRNAHQAAPATHLLNSADPASIYG